MSKEGVKRHESQLGDGSGQAAKAEKGIKVGHQRKSQIQKQNLRKGIRKAEKRQQGQTIGDSCIWVKLGDGF